jgi:hypothetical protein
MALHRRISVDANLVASRAAEFPLIREILGERVDDVINGKQKRADSAPLLLRLLERTGENSRAMLELFSEGIAHFDQLDLPGWREWRGTLGGADRVSLLSRYSELLIALWLTASGFDARAFEPAGARGKRADLLVALEGEELLVEATLPGPHRNDWVEEAMDHLSLALSRVESGLVVAVDGYESLSFDPAGEWGAINPKVDKQQREALVNEFAKAADKIDIDNLPQIVVAPSPGQPVRITAREHRQQLAKDTYVVAGWSRSGLAPNVKRLAEKILGERDHLPDDPPSLILVDLSRWGDFQHADYYLRQVANRIAGRTAPAVFVGNCVGTLHDSKHRLIERGVLASDSGWLASAIGRRFRSGWGGADYTQ